MSLNATPTPEDAPTPARKGRRRFGWGAVIVALVVGMAAAIGGVAGWQALSHPASPSPSRYTVVDDAGRTVTVSSIPSRIVVLEPSAMDIVYRLGIRSKVVGVDCGAADIGGIAADYAPWQIQNWSLTGLACITWLPTLDLQAIISLDPGLVIGATGISVADLSTLQDDDGIPALYLNPSSLLGISHDVDLVAQLTGTTTVAASIDQQLGNELGTVETTVGNASLVTHIPSVLLTYYDDPTGYYTFGPGTFGNDLIVDAGGANIAGNDTFANQGEISGSYVLAADPAIIVVGTGFGLSVQNYSQGPDWSSLGAVQAGHVVGIDATLIAEPDPTMVLVGLPEVFTLLHPGIPLEP